MFLGEYVIDFKGSVVTFLGHETVFATTPCSIPDHANESRVHLTTYDAGDFLSLTRSTRLALDFRIESSVPALA